MKCKLCRCNLTKEKRHYIHKQICLSCISQKMHEGRQNKRDAQAETEIKHSIYQDLKGPYYDMVKCECGTPLLPGAYFKHDRRRCKKCYLEKKAKQGSSRLCNTCKEELPIEQFYEENHFTCRPCLKKYKAERWKVLKACRDSLGI